ncbi:MAG: sialate O-acetylesterase [Bacteroidota bacterium]
MKKNLLLFTLVLFVASMLNAKIKVASILGDNMVLQRNSEVKLWGTTNLNEKVLVKTSWNKESYKTTANNKGEWLLAVKTTEAGGPFTIEIISGKEKLVLNNILLGEVWLCSGQSNMEMPVGGFRDQPVNGTNDALVDADNDNLRLFTVGNNSSPVPVDTCHGAWKTANAESVVKFSAVGYFYAKLIQQKLKVPVGIICSSWGGSKIEAWMSKETVSKFPKAFEETTQAKTMIQQRATQLYNGIIYPLFNFSIKGVIWYQGESNTNSKDYPNLMVGMVNDWRKGFNAGDFPFYYVQITSFIAPYWGNIKKSWVMAVQREAQFKAAPLIPNSGMVTTLDLGEENNVHPAEKFTISKRLSYWALAETYGYKGIYHLNPTFKSFVVKDSSLVVSFENTVNGLTTFGKELDNFEIAGEDHVFHPAKASIVKKEVQLWSPEVIKPVALRYAFYNFPQGKGFLYNTAGLPVPSFRSDNWEK